MRPINRLVAPAVVVAIVATAALPSFSQSLVIAEFMASNQSSIRDDDGDLFDELIRRRRRHTAPA